MVHSSERKWIWGFAALVMVLTSLPYWIGFAQQGSAWHFTGFVFGVNDGNSYIAKMLTGTWGDWLFRSPYTAYPQKGIFLFFPYHLLGKLVGPPAVHLQLISLYQLYRLAAGFLAIFATYDFVAVFLNEIRWRRFATVLAVLGGGFGWLSIAGLGHIFSWGLPLESYSPEAFGFLSIYGLPHLAVARALLLWGLRDFLLRPDWFMQRKYWLRTAVLWAAMGLFQPIIQAVGLFIAALYLLITGIIQIVRWRSGQEAEWGLWKKYFLSGILIALFAAPLVVYTFLSFRLDPVLHAWESQSIIGSPPPLDYFLGYGVALPFALLGSRLLLKEFRWHGWLLAGWLLFAPFAAYGPFTSQRRFLDGFWVVLAILAVYWISKINQRFHKFAFAWMTLAFPMTLFLLTAGILFTIHPAKPLFRPDDEVKAFQYLASTEKTNVVVLAADDSANALPAWAAVHTLVGHGPESINGEALRERISCFFSPACSDVDRKALLDDFEVDFVLWGPGEREIGTWNPNQITYLQPVYQAGEYTVFEYR